MDCNKQVKWSGTPEQIEARIEQLHKTDKSAEKRGPILWVAALIVAFTAFFFGGIYGAIFGVWGRWIGYGIALTLGVLGYRAKHNDIEDRRLDVVRVLVQTFKNELRASSVIDVALDFRGYWRFGRGDSWLVLKMTLENGVTAEVSVQAACKRKSKSKRKYTKIKDKITESVIVRLRPPKGQSLATGLSVGTPRIRLGPLSLRQAKVAPRAATFVFSTPQIIRGNSRYGWRDIEASRVPAGTDVVRALITSYHLLGRAGAQAASPA